MAVRGKKAKEERVTMPKQINWYIVQSAKNIVKHLHTCVRACIVCAADVHCGIGTHTHTQRSMIKRILVLAARRAHPSLLSANMQNICAVHSAAAPHMLGKHVRATCNIKQQQHELVFATNLSTSTRGGRKSERVIARDPIRAHNQNQNQIE